MASQAHWEEPRYTTFNARTYLRPEGQKGKGNGETRGKGKREAENKRKRHTHTHLQQEAGKVGLGGGRQLLDTTVLMGANHGALVFLFSGYHCPQTTCRENGICPAKRGNAPQQKPYWPRMDLIRLLAGGQWLPWAVGKPSLGSRS